MRIFTWDFLQNFFKMKYTTETICPRNYSETTLQNFVKLCSFVHILRNFGFIFFSGSYTRINWKNLAKIKCTGETDCHCNSFKILNRISKNFIVHKDISCTCILTGNSDQIWFFLSERIIRTLAKVHFFVQLMWNWFSINDREAVQTDIFLTVNVQMLHKYDNYW